MVTAGQSGFHISYEKRSIGSVTSAKGAPPTGLSAGARHSFHIVDAATSKVLRDDKALILKALTAFPATPEVVGAYLAAGGEGYAMQTLRRRVAAIARASGVAGHPLDTKHPAIRETLRGIGRTHGSRGRKFAALTTAELRALSRVCDDSLTGDSDRALLLVAFAGALRRSELVALDAEKLTWFDDGVTLLLEKSKTDKAGKGTEVTIVYGRNEATCPVRALRYWLDKAEIHYGPVYRKVNKSGRVEARRLCHFSLPQWRA